MQVRIARMQVSRHGKQVFGNGAQVSNTREQVNEIIVYYNDAGLISFHSVERLEKQSTPQVIVPY